MATNTKIEWCDSTFNAWIGCTKISPGCDHCYAKTMNDRFHGGNWGPGAPRSRTSATYWKEPLKWNRHAGLFRQCGGCGWRGLIEVNIHSPEAFDCPACGGVDWRPARRRVFCASMADWLDNSVPVEWLADLLILIKKTPNIDWLLLTKRIGNWSSRLEEVQHLWAKAASDGSCADSIKYTDFHEWILEWKKGNPPRNVWLGATVVNQVEADRDIPKLLAIPAHTLFLSVEPLLASTILPECTGDHRCVFNGIDGHSDKPLGGIDWVIVGTESGHSARPSDIGWYRSLRDQCADAGVSFFMKQLPGMDGEAIKDMAQFPEDLQIRQFPHG